MTQVTYKNTQHQPNGSISVRLTTLEAYPRLTTALETLTLRENWMAASPAHRIHEFREFAAAYCAHFKIDQMLRSLMPNDEEFKTPLATRSLTNPRCFGEAHTKLLKARDELLLPLLARTYTEFPPTPPAAYRHLRLRDIESLLEKIAYTISHGARVVDNCRQCDRYSFVEDQERQLQFLLDQFYQLTGINADTYQEAVQEYVKLLNSIFPTAVRPSEPSGDMISVVYSVPTQVGI